MTVQAKLPQLPRPQELEALRAIAAGQDSFAGCRETGDFGRRLHMLALLRRAGWIDQAHRLTGAGCAALAAALPTVASEPGR